MMLKSPGLARVSIAGLAAISLVVAISLVHGSPRSQTPSHHSFYFSTEIEADRFLLGEPSELLTGPPEIVAMACRSYLDWLRDVALNPSLIVLRDDLLLRSAELLDGAFGGSEAAGEAERRRVRGVDRDDIVDELRADGFAPAELDAAARYLSELQTPPTAAARGRYGVYLASATATRQMIVRIDITEALTIERPRSRIGAISVELVDGRVVGIPEELCIR